MINKLNFNLTESAEMTLSWEKNFTICSKTTTMILQKLHTAG